MYCLLLPEIFWSRFLTCNYLQGKDQGETNEGPLAQNLRGHSLSELCKCLIISPPENNLAGRYHHFHFIGEELKSEKG